MTKFIKVEVVIAGLEETMVVNVDNIAYIGFG